MEDLLQTILYKQTYYVTYLIWVKMNSSSINYSKVSVIKKYDDNDIAYKIKHPKDSFHAMTIFKIKKRLDWLNKLLLVKRLCIILECTVLASSYSNLVLISKWPRDLISLLQLGQNNLKLLCDSISKIKKNK